MNSILAVAFLAVALSLCNLTDKSQPTANSNSADNKTAETQNASDREALTVELMKLEYELTNASLKGDISTLARHIADDYVGTGADGTMQNKNQLLAATKPDKRTRSWTITDAKLTSFSGDSAVLTYLQSQTFGNGQTYRARITDTFVKRDGRWLITAEQQTLVK